MTPNYQAGLQVEPPPKDFLELAFPFHIGLNRQGEINRLGQGLSRLCPEFNIGQAAAAVLAIRRPENLLFRFEDLEAVTTELFILVTLRGRITLRGQVVFFSRDDSLIFLVSPWVNRIEDVTALDLRLNDFAIHNPITDFLQAQQAQIAALEDVKRLAERLRCQKSELRSAHAAMAASEQQYREVVQNLKEVVFQTDAEGNWILLNEAWTEILGFSVAESLGTCFLEYVHPEDRDRNNQLFLPLIQRKKSYCRHEIRYLTKDGSYKWVEVFARLTIDAGDRVTGTAGTLNDVTDRRLATERLEQAKDEAEAASAAKTQYLAFMSHEIRNPLTVLLGFIELAVDSPEEKDRAEYLTLCQSSVLTLRDMVNDVLDFSKINAGKLHLEETAFDLRRLSEEVLRPFQFVGRKKQVSVIWDLNAAIPHTVYGDPMRYRQIVTNLVSNALKFTAKGQVRFSASPSSRTSSENLMIEFCVADTGPGISPEQQQNLFQPFSQAERSTARKYGGSGLGLSICKRLTEMMGGTIWVTSNPGTGTEFRFTLTFGLAPSARSAEPDAEVKIRRTDPDPGPMTLSNEGRKAEEGLMVDGETASLKAAAPLMNYDSALEGAGGDADLLEKLVDLFREESADMMARIDLAIQNRKSSDLAFNAHRLRGSLRILSVPAVELAARGLEKQGIEEKWNQVPVWWAELHRGMGRLLAELERFR